MTHTHDLTSQARKLQELFNNSNPIAFAKELRLGKTDGRSNRKLAKLAGCSEAHVRDVLNLLRLPLPMQASIESGAPYRQHLVRLKRVDDRRKKAANTASKVASTVASEQGAKVLADWCEKLNFVGGYAEQILGDVKGHILSAEEARTLGSSVVDWRGSPEKIFEANFPRNYRELDFIDSIFAAVRCIARSLVALMPNAEARYHALELALENPRLRAAW